MSEQTAAASPDMADDGGYEESYDESSADSAAAPAAPNVVPANVDTTQALVITATVNMHADDVAKAATGVLDLVASSGGVVEARNIVNDDVEDGTRGSASLTARVPPDKAEAFINDLGTIATVDSVAQEADDVSDQLADLDLRIENAEKSVERIRDLMDQATKIEDLTNLEYELSNRQVALEQLKAQKANLGNEVGMATVYISIRSTADLATGPTAPTDVSLVGAAENGWRGFVEVLYSILLVLATLWPIIVLAILGFVTFKWIRRRRRNRRSGGDPTPPSDHSPIQGRPPHEGSALPSPQVN